MGVTGSRARATTLKETVDIAFSEYSTHSSFAVFSAGPMTGALSKRVWRRTDQCYRVKFLEEIGRAEQ
jgi:hypothetical protein